MPRKDNANTPASAQAQQDAVSEGIENFELPRALVTRIAKSAVPENVKLQKDTVLSLVKGATVFINYLAATAHEVSTSKQHKSISASDVFKALELIEFDDFIPPLQAELQGTFNLRLSPQFFFACLTFHTRLISVYRELAKNKKGSTTGGASSSATTARNKSSSAAQRGKGKERMTETSESGASAPLPNALGSLSLEPKGTCAADRCSRGSPRSLTRRPMLWPSGMMVKAKATTKTRQSQSLNLSLNPMRLKRMWMWMTWMTWKKMWIWIGGKMGTIWTTTTTM
ncbi:hypothetical protein F5148DRAFT_700012 [Russula earlei]|uniref:Uncharacterized protein n=1 Tax=Russula earlei TaxID=71964 RepID=A0ACC0UDG1_9AGAM|nr:hypothetical protein F5148DRAFT_700012 [Russula earlei]